MVPGSHQWPRAQRGRATRNRFRGPKQDVGTRMTMHIVSRA